MSELHALTVRMYRGLLGDCFLLRLENADGSRQHVLIDCGLLQGLPRASERMAAVASDIAETTGGVVDLLVVTHEHWDHISGFAQAKEILLDPARIRYRRLWMAWTEKPGDAQAEALRARFDRRKQAVSRLAMALDERQIDGPGAKILRDLNGFIGPLDPPGVAAAPGGRLTGARILEELRSLAGEVDYLEPGAVMALPLDIALPVAVLGPPRSEERLFKDLPSSGAGKETYLGEAADAAPAAGDPDYTEEELANYSLFGIDGARSGEEVLELGSPFAPRYHAGLKEKDVRNRTLVPGASADLVDWFHRHYYARDDEQGQSQGERRIDDASFQAPAALALKLDSDTNNTSLVLAIRLPDDRFMLFAADAQVGNWLSWHDQDYAFADRRWSAEEILGATALYKVGHHGSHNATLKGQGLAMMTRDDLVALVSTVEEEARSQGRPPGWLMPNPAVRTALLERTQGRLIRGDRRWSEDADVAAFGRDRAFAARLDEQNSLYVDYRIWPPPAKRKRRSR